MTTEQIENKVKEYITEVDRKRVNQGFFDIDSARKVWTYEKLAELELRVESLELKNKSKKITDFKLKSNDEKM